MKEIRKIPIVPKLERKKLYLGLDKQDLPPGIIYVPYIIETTSTSINNTTVWYKNKWKNLWLKIKFFFKKPDELKRLEKYFKKPIDPKLYKEIKITK